MFGRRRFCIKRKLLNKRRRSGRPAKSRRYQLLIMDPIELNNIIHESDLTDICARIYQETLERPTPIPVGESPVGEEPGPILNPRLQRPFRPRPRGLDAREIDILSPLPEGIETTPTPTPTPSLLSQASQSSSSSSSSQSSDRALYRKQSISSATFSDETDEIADLFSTSESVSPRPEKFIHEEFSRSSSAGSVSKSIKSPQKTHIKSLIRGDSPPRSKSADILPRSSPRLSVKDSPKSPPKGSPKESPRSSPKGAASAHPTRHSPRQAARSSPRKFPADYVSSPRPQSKQEILGDSACSSPIRPESAGHSTSSSSSSGSDPIVRSTGPKPEDFECTGDPFKICSVANFIYDKNYLEELTQYLMHDAVYVRRDSDLFSYHQADDKPFMKNDIIKRLLYTFSGTLAAWLSHVTGSRLNPAKITVTSSKYYHKDYLLCHDDISGDRKIAFVLYLNDDWESQWGGTLDLFMRDHNNDPSFIAKTLIPEYNKFYFFEVTTRSYHQVSEIVVKEKCRLTVNGWFHGPRKLLQVEPDITRLTTISYKNLVIPEGIYPGVVNSDCLVPENFLQNRVEFRKKGTTSLAAFLRPDVYEKFLNALNVVDDWHLVGPPNRRRYEILPESSIVGVVKDVLRILVSQPSFKLMYDITKLRLHEDSLTVTPEERESLEHQLFVGSLPTRANKGIRDGFDPNVSVIIRRWRQGFYSMANDDELSPSDVRCLDVIFFAGIDDEGSIGRGGEVGYANKDTGNLIHCIRPFRSNNVLHLTLINREMYRFRKFINYDFKGYFYDVLMIYRES